MLSVTVKRTPFAGISVEVDQVEKIVRITLVFLERVHLLHERLVSHFWASPLAELVVLGTDQRSIFDLLLDFKNETGAAG